MKREHRVGVLPIPELVKAGEPEDGSEGYYHNDLEGYFGHNEWARYKDVFEGNEEPDWHALNLTPGHFYLHTTYDPSPRPRRPWHFIVRRHDPIKFTLEILVNRPDDELYVLNQEHLFEITEWKFPRQDDETPAQHCERALTKWIATDDFAFNGFQLTGFDSKFCLPMSGNWVPPTRKT